MQINLKQYVLSVMNNLLFSTDSGSSGDGKTDQKKNENLGEVQIDGGSTWI
jgi:hypothetical protein